MWMTEYIQEIQKKLITEYKFEKGSNGCPIDVPDGSYPMIIDWLRFLSLPCHSPVINLMNNNPENKRRPAFPFFFLPIIEAKA